MGAELAADDPGGFGEDVGGFAEDIAGKDAGGFADDPGGINMALLDEFPGVLVAWLDPKGVDAVEDAPGAVIQAQACAPGTPVPTHVWPGSHCPPHKPFTSPHNSQQQSGRPLHAP
ncbi:hypothetical protein K8942_00915 [Candidatus Peribacteria bacterium]|nr:MAG: hypothetical protein K8942_00915 [Candidatus Peribacteria bacterium]